MFDRLFEIIIFLAAKPFGQSAITIWHGTCEPESATASEYRYSPAVCFLPRQIAAVAVLVPG
jgi:hypothetical protein